MNEQQSLLTLIYNDNPTLLAESGLDIRGITIYRRNLLANAQRALSITFPTIFQLLDSDVSEDLVQQFLALCPPSQGDWGQWGEEFSHFIATSQIAYDYPYLPDCAMLDWHIHHALHGVDQLIDHASLQRLGDSEPEHIKVQLNKNVALITSKYPINDIFYAHHHSEDSQRKSAMLRAKETLTSSVNAEQVFMVFRPEFQPKVITLTESESIFVNALQQQKSLADALDAVSHLNDFSFENWLLTAIEQNLIYQFKAEQL
ncbi:DNA-binding domain-containing protein [Psychromonas sp.]|nr:DNA-binding domain-containing protein [Psychromonas sp.]